jgi:Uma2 family endonuclease
MTTASTTQPLPPVPMAPASPRLSIDEFTARHAGQRVELVKGIVKELPMTGTRHGYICTLIAAQLFQHVVSNKLGRVMSNDTWVVTGPDSVRGGDVIYCSFDRLPPGDLPDGPLSVPPELVVEVRSPSDRWSDIFTKVGEYLRIGVNAVVVLDPATESASVYRPDVLQQIFRKTDTLTLPDVLPGFAVPVAQLFA